MDQQVLDSAKSLAETILASKTWQDYTEYKEQLIAESLFLPMMQYDQAKLILKSDKPGLKKDAQEIVDTYEETMQSAHVRAYRQAESRLNTMIANVNHTILHFLGNEFSKGSSCGGNCASCSGCAK